MTEELPSSSQLLDDSPDRHLSSSIEEGKPNQLLKEVEVLKGSHLKEITETNLLEQELECCIVLLLVEKWNLKQGSHRDAPNKLPYKEPTITNQVITDIDKDTVLMLDMFEMMQENITAAVKICNKIIQDHPTA
ncbi:hypothetical protein Lser_V15G02175 [Lactuca serriola]